MVLCVFLLLQLLGATVFYIHRHVKQGDTQVASLVFESTAKP
jgi:hypothetical protein